MTSGKITDLSKQVTRSSYSLSCLTQERQQEEYQKWFAKTGKTFDEFAAYAKKYMSFAL